MLNNMDKKFMNKNQLEILGQKNSFIVTYEGIEGVKTVSRNSLNAKKNLYIYEAEFASLNVIFSKEEAEKIRKEFLSRKMKIKEITNKAYHEYTDIKEFDRECMEIRYLNPDKFNIQHEFMIYDDIVAFYSYSKDIFAIEIHNENFAKAQLQIFNLMWNLAERPIIGKNGRSSML